MPDPDPQPANSGPSDPDALPSYDLHRTDSVFSSSSASRQTQHTYRLDSPDVTLTLESQASKPDALPLFTKQATVGGVVDLKLKKSETIKGVVLKFEGKIMAVASNQRVFWAETHDIWTPTAGPSEKLQGEYSWPFSFQLPATATLCSKTSTQEVPLPPTLSGLSQIRYRVDVLILRGRFTTDDIIGTEFHYLPRSRAESPSLKRLHSYDSTSGLVGPDVDPDGWETLDPVSISGKLFENRTVELTYKLSIAKPISYARATVIPLVLDLQTSDPQAIELLCQPNTPVVGLVRNEAADHKSSDLDLKDSSHGSMWSQVSPANKDVIVFDRTDTCVGTAVWWPSPDGVEGRLHGEIRLAGNLVPSFKFWIIAVNYYIQVLPPDVPGFKAPKGERSKTLISFKVPIVTDPASGTAGRSLVPPAYYDEERRKKVKQTFDFMFNPW